MPPRHVLIVDQDQSFVALLRSALSSAGFEVHEVDDDDSGLKLILQLKPTIVVVGVELPDKTGFGFCNKAKRLPMRVRVVLATSSVPWTEMTMHQKLTVHADAYWRKEVLTDEKLLLEKLGELIELEAPEDDPAATSDEVRDQPAEAPDEDAWLIELLSSGMDEEAARAIQASEAGRNASHPAGDEDLRAALRIGQLEREVERLQGNLETTRRDAGSSPFSASLRMGEEAKRRDAEISDLNASVQAHELKDSRRREQLLRMANIVIESRSQTEQAADQVAQLEAARDTAEQSWQALQEEVGQLREELNAHQTTMLTLQKTHADELEKVRLEGPASLKQLRLRLREEEARLAASRDQDASSRIAAERKRHADELAAFQKAMREALLAKEAEKDVAVLHAGTQRDEALARLQGKHRQEIDRLRAEHETALGQLENERQATQASAARTAALHAEALKQAEESRERDLAAKEADAEDLRQSAAHATAQHAETLKQAEERRERDLAAKESEKATLRQAAEQRETALGQLLKQHDKEIASLKSSHAATISRLEDEHQRAAKHHSSALSELSDNLRAERAQALAAVTAEWERRTEDERQQHASMLEAKVRDHRSEVAQLQKAHQETLALEDEEGRQALTRLVEERETALTTAEAKQAAALVELAGQHRQSIAKLTAEHTQAVSLLQDQLHEAERAKAATEETLRQQSGEAQRKLEMMEAQQGEAWRLAEMQAGHSEALREAETKRASSIEALAKGLQDEKAQLERARLEERQSHAQALAGLQSRHEHALARREAELQANSEKHRAGLADLQQRDAAELAGQQAAHEAMVAQLKQEASDHLARLEREQSEHATSLAALRKGHDQEAAALRKTHEQALLDRDQEARARLQQLAAQHADALAAKDSEREAALAGLRQSHREEDEALQLERQAAALAKVRFSAALAAKDADKDAVLAKLQQRHRQELDTLKAQHAAALKQAEQARKQADQALKQAEQARKQAVAALQAELTKLRDDHLHSLLELQKSHAIDKAAPPSRAPSSPGEGHKAEKSYEDLIDSLDAPARPDAPAPKEQPDPADQTVNTMIDDLRKQD
jgi:response regulator RpfG family c-di-GMP phosphodiesterase